MMAPRAAGDDFGPDLAQELIDEFGIIGTAHLGDRDFNEIEGELTIDDEDVPVTLTPPLQYEKELIVDDVRKTNASVSYMLPTIEPFRGMAVTINAQRWKVLKVEPIVSGKLTAAFALFLER